MTEKFVPLFEGEEELLKNLLSRIATGIGDIRLLVHQAEESYRKINPEIEAHPNSVEETIDFLMKHFKQYMKDHYKIEPDVLEAVLGAKYK